MAFSDWSTTASANAFVGGVAIGEGCPPSNLNNMGREMMAQLRSAFAPGLKDFFVCADTTAARVKLGAMSAAGGEVGGNITRKDAGSHIYHTNAAFGSGRIFFTAPDAPDPTSLAGDIWITGA